MSDELAAMLSQLSVEQVRWLIARVDCTSDKEAAEALGWPPQKVYNWRRDSDAPLDAALELMKRDGMVVAMHLRRRHLAEAMAVKCGGLRSGDEAVRQRVATEIVEWEMGKATQRQESKVSTDDKLTTLLERLTGDD